MARTETVKFRMDPTEKRTFQEAAELSGLSLSAWMRRQLRRAAVRELEEASRPIRFLERKGS
jgi:hypothetical protein